MKRFKQMIKEYYMTDDRTPEERNADAHLYDMIMADNKHRNEMKITNTLPLEYNMDVLLALRNHYLGSKHPQLHPDHAKELKTYESTINKNFSHLKPYMQY